MIDQPKILKIDEVRDENPTVKTFVFKGFELGAMPGQFVNLWIPRVDEKPFSVAYCDKDEFWLTVAAVGPFSKKLHEFKEGDKVGIRGPYGKGYTIPEGKKIALLAGGYGAAPLYFVAHEAASRGCEVEFIVGARNKDLLLYLDRIEVASGMNLHVATDDGSVGREGYNTAILEELVGGVDMVMTCGPEVMMKAAMGICEKAGIQIEVSIERYMKCGSGVCGNCCVDGLGVPVCKSGPVFPGDMARKIEGLGEWHRDNVGLKVLW
ncbi:MAG: dihydroorotate dehydrogenase electron transfer subunit [Patescibacteria group bacterium]